MRCKVGDLCVIVSPAPGAASFLGRIVQVVRQQGEDAWICEPQLYVHEILSIWWLDTSLCPIRDQPGADETLTWAPVPQKEHA